MKSALPGVLSASLVLRLGLKTDAVEQVVLARRGMSAYAAGGEHFRVAPLMALSCQMALAHWRRRGEGLHAVTLAATR